MLHEADRALCGIPGVSRTIVVVYAILPAPRRVHRSFDLSNLDFATGTGRFRVQRRPSLLVFKINRGKPEKVLNAFNGVCGVDMEFP